MPTMKIAAPCALLLVAACGGSSPPASRPADPDNQMDQMIEDGMHMGADTGSQFGPLEAGADLESYIKLNSAAFPSPTHGGRMVDVYVNEIGVAAYRDPEQEAEIPVGTIVVKTSMEPDGSAGPIFVMEKRAAGFNPEQGDWWYAIHWAEPPAKWAKKLGGPIYWRTPSKQAQYCSDCHDSFERELGGVPAEQRAY